MPYCTRCGSPVNYEEFCSKCGVAVNNGLPTPLPLNPPVTCPSEQSNKSLYPLVTVFGLTFLIIGLFMALLLNSVYSRQAAYLAEQGIQVNTYTFGFNDIASLIAAGIGMAAVGIYLIIFGILNQFSAKVRAATASKDGSRNFLLTVGLSFIFIVLLNEIHGIYFPRQASGIWPIDAGFAATGIIMISLSVWLFRRAYLRSVQPTKV
jgi:hypothetical protein